MTQARVQHEATLQIGSRQVKIHAPPFVPEKQLDSWLAETLRAEGVTLVSKTWGSLGCDTDPSPNPERSGA
jgi:uncharacterized protein (DUF608 family)